MNYWLWRLRNWWAFLPWTRFAFKCGYLMGWHEHPVMGGHLNEDAAYSEWVSKLDER